MLHKLPKFHYQTVFTYPRSKGNQTIKFGQLICYNIEIFFSKGHIQNMVEKRVPDPFLKN